MPKWARNWRHKVSNIELTCEPRISLHAMHGAANSQGNRDRIWVIGNRANQVTHGLAGKLIPWDGRGIV